MHSSSENTENITSHCNECHEEKAMARVLWGFWEGSLMEVV
jgi:hypothetical protein